MDKDSKICSLGIWDSSVPGISFDESGVSNYAKIQLKLMENYPRGKKGEDDWAKIVADVKKNRKGKYDCIVGISGGVDSSYLLYLLKIEYGLSPLAVTLDNGWSTDIAVKNIRKITTALDIDLETYVINYQEIKDLLRSYMYAGLPWIDMPTDVAIKSVMYKYAAQENVKYIFRGNDFRSEGKQPRPWTYGDDRQLRYLHKRFGRLKNLNSFPYLPFYKIISAGFLKRIKDIRPYYYIDYNKEHAKAFLESQFGWEYYGGHHHENIFTKFAMSVWLPNKFGIDKRVINLSAQVLAGTMSRQQAIYELQRPALDREEQDKLTSYVIKKLDISGEEYVKIFNSPNKSYRDYPNLESQLFFILKFFKPLIKLVYAQRPMTFVEMEVNGR